MRSQALPEPSLEFLLLCMARAGREKKRVFHNHIPLAYLQVKKKEGSRVWLLGHKYHFQVIGVLPDEE